ncbi:hypothetical protein SSP35_19_01390 [Streptomyces sp. NBRC 110611]|uniref:hypothetical protein n=1 Tax=Streptomyces sp. NBRC 110611 TaxID=1621259 RepID=UPI000856DC26|nr:hypothetical protein [Streptomyces sp. NBRC 110611]GAU70501.1 hypothetical protein SSP35_19_01390 [Streptomyces sp. NBRC 110611]
MRDAIARALYWVLALLPWTRRPEPGRHSAAHLADQPALPVICTCPIPLHVLARSIPPREQFRIPPYLAAWEERHERERQRERRVAATLATMGIDYPYGPGSLTDRWAVSA